MYYEKLINKKITLDRVCGQSLDEILSGSLEVRNDYERTFRLIVRGVLARNEKQYDESIENLRKMWGTPINIWTVQERNKFYVYMELNNLGRYIFVTSFLGNTPFIEEVPLREKNEN